MPRKTKGFRWCPAFLRRKPRLSFVPGCLCKARARGLGRQVVGGSAWSAGTSWIEHRLAKCHLCSERRSSVALAHRAGTGWTSRCCTSSPRSAHGKHTLPSAFPAGDKKKSNEVSDEVKTLLYYCPLLVDSGYYRILLLLQDHTHRSVQMPFAVHGQVEATINTTDAHQPHSQADKLQNTCMRGKEK